MNIQKIVNEINLKREVKAYNTYLKLNRKRVPVSNVPLFQVLDEVRRRIGFIGK